MLRFDSSITSGRSMAFVGAPFKAASFTGTPVSSRCTRRSSASVSVSTPRAELDLIPGVPSGQDARDNAPLRHYVPRPVETYDDRSFSTPLPKNWAGEDFYSIGAGDVPPLTKEGIEKAREYPVSAASTGAFVAFNNMVKDERAAMLKRQAERNAMPQDGRATCGESEGKEYVSNYQEILTEGVFVSEYWGRPNGPVPRLFGGPGE